VAMTAAQAVIAGTVEIAEETEVETVVGADVAGDLGGGAAAAGLR
jgi:hypothetical protein